jgi:hypothetical protein
VVIPIKPVITAPIEFTFIINIIPTKIAIAAITNAQIFITASGNNRCGKKVIASEIGPPNTVSEIRKTASRASDSKAVT